VVSGRWPVVSCSDLRRRSDRRLLESAHAALATTHGMAGLRRVFDHPCLLVHDSSVCRAVARAASFIPWISVCLAAAPVDGDVVRGGAGHAAVAGYLALSCRLGVGRSGFAVRFRAVYLFAIREEFQRQATRRAARGSRRKSRSAAGDGWNPVASAASGVPSASLRDAGMERRDRPRGVLGADGVRSGHRSGDDPDGGCGVREEVWRLVPRVSQIRTGGSAKSVPAAPAIIRSN